MGNSTNTLGDSPFDWNQSHSGDVTDYTEPDSQMLAIIDSLLPGRALDLGCGAGGLVVALARMGWRVTGIDMAQRAIDAALHLVEERNVTAELYVADAATLKPDGPSDLITSSFALPGTRGERTARFQMIREALVPGGTVLLKDFDSTMSRVEFFDGFDLVIVEEIASAFDGLSIVRAEVVETPVHTQLTRAAINPENTGRRHFSRPVTADICLDWRLPYHGSRGGNLLPLPPLVWPSPALV